MTTRIKPDEQRKQQIRTAATRCFVRRGFAATRLLDIAREAGLSKGGVYFHYRAKEALFHDILEAQFAALQARWDTQQASDQPADTALRGLVLTHLQSLEQSPDEARFCNLMISMASQNPEFREKFDLSLSGMRSRYAEIIRRGEFGGDPVQLAGGVIALIYGVAAQSAADPQASLPLTSEQVADLAVRLVRGPA
ncbi:MAG TPA: TetR/AcrR family transcriptional regulator [Nannocystis sp.]